MIERRYRYLFCIPTTQLSGGVKVIFAIADRMVEAGHEVHLFSWANQPEWYALKARLLTETDISAVDMTGYDFVIVSNAMMIPMVLTRVKHAKCVFLAQDYEAFHHSREIEYESFLADSPIFKALYSLPVPIIATSRPIKRLVEERIGKRAYLMPVGLDKSVFKPQERRLRDERKRILLVGNYLMPYKGMRDGLAALELLAAEMPVELVLITQEERGRKMFDSCSFPVEIHFCPAEAQVPGIMATCDVYCCTSWYEGLGLPALEAFCCGTPVVSTRTLGVDDYAEDGTNLLLAAPNDPADLAEKLRRVLTEPDLRGRLVAGGFKTVDGRYDWSTSAAGFLSAIDDIDATYAGAANVHPDQMQDLLNRLEDTGSFTPVEVFREFQDLVDRLNMVCASVRHGQVSDSQLHEVMAVRDALAKRMSNEQAQYYGAFKAKFDFCQLMLALASGSESRFTDVLITRSRQPSTRTNASSLTEIAYPKQ